MKLPESLEQVISCFKKLPGVGEKTAIRQTLQLTNWNVEDLKEFSVSLNELLNLKKCQKCFLLSDQLICDICSNHQRGERKILCVVEGVSDCIAIENSEQFNGIYHILGGVLNPLLGVGPKELGLDHLVARIKEEAIEEVILAINPSVEGDATCSYIHSQLADNVKVERIGFGIPIGGSLEYLDSMTISKALENRRVYS